MNPVSFAEASIGLRSSRGRSRLVWYFCLLGLLGLAGCDQLDPIRVYTVDKPAPAHRMLGAIIPQDGQTWFFKVTGPNAEVQRCSDAFRRFVESISFQDGTPRWELPEGWIEEPASRMRYATLRIETTTPPLELSVIPLPPPPGNAEQSLLANINRWRGQLQLSSLAAEELDRHTTRISLDAESGLVATLVEFEGQTGGSGMGPMAPPRTAPPRTAPPRGAPPPPSAPEIAYDRPDGWTEGQRESTRGGIRIKRAAVLQVTDGEQQAEVSVTRLGAANRLGNINRWRSTVGLPAAAPQELQLEKVEFAGLEADYTELIGAEQAILGVIAEDANAAWFVKFQGPHDLVLRERERFREFVASIRFAD